MSIILYNYFYLKMKNIVISLFLSLATLGEIRANEM